MTHVLQPYVRIASPSSAKPSGTALHPVTAAVAGFGAVLMAVLILPQGWSRPAGAGTFHCEQRTRRAGRSWVSRGAVTLPVQSHRGRSLVFTLRSEPCLGPAADVLPDGAAARRVVARGVAYCGGHRGFVTLREHPRLLGSPRPELVLEWSCDHTQRRLALSVEGAGDDDLAELLTTLNHVRCH
ncbi:MAG: hypothetical protein ACM3ZA_00435 [Bacillota bacterium]